MKTVANSLIDPKAFGFYLRRERTEAGFETTSKFSRSIEEYTSCYISKGTLDRIEAGRQEPKLSQLVAITLTLCNYLPYVPVKSNKDIVAMSMYQFRK